jgi:Uma2 family endonuclease
MSTLDLPYAYPDRDDREDDLDALPEGMTGQLIDGELLVHPRPNAPHTEAASELGAALIPAFRHGEGGPGGWVILHEPGIRLSRGSLLVPDLAGWRQERFHSPRRGPYLVPPDWVCEVLSASTARDDRVRKLPVYARAGVGFAWLIDPELQTLEVLGLRDGLWQILGAFASTERVRAAPFEAVELDLTRLWGEPREESPKAGDDLVCEPAAVPGR